MRYAPSAQCPAPRNSTERYHIFFLRSACARPALLAAFLSVRASLRPALHDRRRHVLSVRPGRAPRSVHARPTPRCWPPLIYRPQRSLSRANCPAQRKLSRTKCVGTNCATHFVPTQLVLDMSRILSRAWPLSRSGSCPIRKVLQLQKAKCKKCNCNWWSGGEGEGGAGIAWCCPLHPLRPRLREMRCAAWRR